MTGTVGTTTTSASSREAGVPAVCENRAFGGDSYGEAISKYGVQRAFSTAETANFGSSVNNRAQASAFMHDMISLSDGFIAGGTYTSSVGLMIHGRMGTGVSPNDLGYRSRAITSMGFLVRLRDVSSANEQSFRLNFRQDYSFQRVSTDLADPRNYKLRVEGALSVNGASIGIPGGLAFAPEYYALPISMVGGRTYRLSMSLSVETFVTDYEAVGVSDASNSFYWAGLQPFTSSAGIVTTGLLASESGTNWFLIRHEPQPRLG